MLIDVSFAPKCMIEYDADAFPKKNQKSTLKNNRALLNKYSQCKKPKNWNLK